MNELNQNYLDLFHQIDFQKVTKHPNILIAARFWDEERYEAAHACYRVMRAIDDFIDDYKATHQKIRETERSIFEERVHDWLRALQEQGKTSDPLRRELKETIKRFKIPIWTMQQFARAMIYDICHNGYNTLEEFLDYSQGASVAPSSVFVHLCGLQKNDNSFSLPPFNVREAATPCAMFSYLVHTIRDFQKDQLNNLNCFAGDLMSNNGLTTKDMRAIAKGAKITEGFRGLIRDYLRIADIYRLKTLEVIQQISPLIEPRYRLSLQIIFNLYQMVYERIDPENGSFTTEELNPTPEEIRERVLNTIYQFEPVLA